MLACLDIKMWRQVVHEHHEHPYLSAAETKNDAMNGVVIHNQQHAAHQ